MKSGKEMKLESFKNYNITYGSVNNKKPKALFINISAWAEPRSNSDLNYNRIIRDMDKKIRQTIYDTLMVDLVTPFVKDWIIIDFDMRESGVRYGKRSFLSCEITLYMKHEIPANSESLKPIINQLINSIIESSFGNCRYFRFHKRKK